MTRLLTVGEYADATAEIQQLMSELAESEVKALRKAIKELQTIRGIRDRRRRANTKAARYIETAKTAARIEALAQLSSTSLEDEELGRQRLAAATEEMFPGWTNARKKEREAKREQKAAGKPIEHGLKAYRKGICRCAVFCTPANTAAVREQRRRKKQRDHEARQHTGETTEASSATSEGGQQTLADVGQGDYTAEHPEALRTAHSAAA